MADCMTFPETLDEFLEQYQFKDSEEIYTNGSMLIPVFRVKQWAEHAADVRENDELDEMINEAVLTLNNIYIACRIKKDDYVRLLNDLCAIRGAQMGGADDD